MSLQSIKIPRDHILARVRKNYRINIDKKDAEAIGIKEGDWVIVIPINFRKGSEYLDCSEKQPGDGDSQSR